MKLVMALIPALAMIYGCDARGPASVEPSTAAAEVQPAPAPAAGSAALETGDAAAEPDGDSATDLRPDASQRDATPGNSLHDITFDSLKFAMEKGQTYKPSMLTKSIQDLKGKRVRIRGYMLPTSVFQQTGITQFVLVRDNMECCFGPGAMIYDCMMVQLGDGNSTEYEVRPIAVEGVFEIQEVRLDDELLGLYHLREGRVR